METVRSARRITLAFIVAFAARSSPTPTLAAPVIPGATITASLSPLVEPFALGYDFKMSKLYTVARDNLAGPWVFGSINQVTGSFTQIPTTTSLATAGSFVPGIEFSIKGSNPLTRTPAHAFILRNDGLLNVNVGTGMVSVKPAPSPNAPTAIGSDSLSAILYGRTSAGLADITPRTGAETIIAPYSYGGRVATPVSAVDPYHGVFFIEESQGIGPDQSWTLDIINEATGVVSKIALSTGVIGLAFDASSGPQSAALYGITWNTSGSNLVRINTTTGAETVIATVGNALNSFPYTLPSYIDANDIFFTTSTSSTSSLVSADTTVDRSWYVESPIGEPLTTLNSWMTSAGQAMGVRDAGLPSGRVANAILDFGQPSKSKTNGQFGATFRMMRFLSTSAIQNAVIAFADGWYAGLAGAAAPALRIVVGTNNYGLDSFDFDPPTGFGPGATKQHGAAWATMISNITSVLATRPYAPRVTIIAGMDTEMLYSHSPAVAAWATGFGSRNYADYGNAQGCPNACDGGWTPNEVVTLGGTAFFPEIYGTGATASNSWAGLSAFNKKTFGAPLNIVAPLSQLTACVQRVQTNPNEKCATPGSRENSSPAASWVKLVGALQNAIPGSAGMIGPSTNIEHRVP